MSGILKWSWSLAILALVGLSFAYPNPEAVTGNTDLHDPTLCKDDSGTYFLYSTGVGIEIRTSTDRTAWTFVGLVWPDGDSWTDEYTGTSNGSLWAPDCTYIDGQFYLYYAASTLGSQNSGIFLAKSTTGLPGSFTNEGLITSTATGDTYNAIDPNLIIGEHNPERQYRRPNLCKVGSEWYLSLGSFWTGIKGVPLDPSTGKLSSSTFDSLAERSGTGAMEASVIYEYGDYYYLFTSWDKCCEGTSSTYNIRVGRSESLTSDYVDADGVALLSGGGTLILETHDSVVGPGGQDILTDDDGIVLVYHYYTSSGNWLGINHLDFSSGWPVVVE
ncbi:hypothetical protein M0805_003606 [Coniferiporia weirii]|nr:hypothetical protein M0805_003606 [Coniferiporia weirii]